MFNHVQQVVLSFEIRTIIIVGQQACLLLIYIHVYRLVITRDCSTYWPQVHAKSGLHKLLGSDAFFCQESLYVLID
jgi:hypothetical protein